MRAQIVAEADSLSALAKGSIALSEVDFFQESESEANALRGAIRSSGERLVFLAHRLLEIALPVTELWDKEASYIPLVLDKLVTMDLVPFNGKLLAMERDASVVLAQSKSTLPSFQGTSGGNRPPTSALSQLKLSHERFLSHLAVYFSPLAMSGGPDRISDTTTQCIKIARNFLGLVSTIIFRLNAIDHPVSVSLQKSSDQLFTDCSNLAHTTKGVFSSRIGLSNAEITDICQAATACVRSVGECVAFGQCALEAIGDFEFSQ